METEAIQMNVEKDARSGIAEIDYSRDTLFGPIPMQATCRVRLVNVERDGEELRELTIVGDLPDGLGKSMVIRVALDGKIEAGPIERQDSLNDAEPHEFRILFKNERKRSMH
jgi:hypothetical protein